MYWAALLEFLLCGAIKAGEEEDDSNIANSVCKADPGFASVC